MVFNFPKNGNSDFSLFVPTLWHRPCLVRSSKVSHLRILHHLATTHTVCAPRYLTPVTTHTFLRLHYWADNLNQKGFMKRKWSMVIGLGVHWWMCALISSAALVAFVWLASWYKVPIVTWKPPIFDLGTSTCTPVAMMARSNFSTNANKRCWDESSAYNTMELPATVQTALEYVTLMGSHATVERAGSTLSWISSLVKQHKYRKDMWGSHQSLLPTPYCLRMDVARLRLNQSSGWSLRRWKPTVVLVLRLGRVVLQSIILSQYPFVRHAVVRGVRWRRRRRRRGTYMVEDESGLIGR